MSSGLTGTRGHHHTELQDQPGRRRLVTDDVPRDRYRLSWGERAEVNTRMVSLVGQVRRSALLKCATIDGDTTDVEVFGQLKQNAAYSHTGQRNLRPHLCCGPRPGCRWPAS